MTTLRPMRPDTYPAYVESSIEGYAQDNISSGRWPEAGALERSRREFDALLPAGLDTPDNFLFEILDEQEGQVVGFVWYAIERKKGPCSAYIYDLEIKIEHRRKGHALRALQALESIAAAAGANSMGLNVFANNLGAQELYNQLGYAPTNFNMRKPLHQPIP